MVDCGVLWWTVGCCGEPWGAVVNRGRFWRKNSWTSTRVFGPAVPPVVVAVALSAVHVACRVFFLPVAT